MNFGIKSLLYGIYEWSLKKNVLSTQNVPKHIGLILDGNRRGATLIGISEKQGYQRGADKFEEVLDWCFEIGIKIISVWIFSTENYKREMKKVKKIMELAEEKTKKIRTNKRIHKQKVKVIFSGERDQLTHSLLEEIKKTEARTRNYENYILNICIAYGGRAEIISAVKNIAQKVKDNTLAVEDITEDIFSKQLYTNGLPDPDLIIRTSGEIRLSGFLLWQCSYSELYFTDIFWPLIRKIDFLRAIRVYQSRKRNFGK